MAKPTPPATAINRQTTEPTQDTQEQIRHRAYELYEQRGGEHGHDVDDWLQAEMELTHQKPEKVAA